MSSRQSKLQEDTNYRVLRLLQNNPNLTQRELAKALGISLGGLNYCVQALLEKGSLKIHNFQSSSQKLAYAYLLTPAGIAEKTALTGRFLKRKLEEYELLKAEIESLQQVISEASPIDGLAGNLCAPAIGRVDRTFNINPRLETDVGKPEISIN